MLEIDGDRLKLIETDGDSREQVLPQQVCRWGFSLAGL